MTKEEFLAAASKAAQAASAKSGLPVGITVAQAALESGWGKSWLSQEANNYFGIKAYGGRASVVMETRECNQAGEYKCVANFARFASMEECFEARDQLILRMSCYAGARAVKNEPEAFAGELAKHWATDPKYAERLLAVYNENKLQKLDASRGTAVASK